MIRTATIPLPTLRSYCKMIGYSLFKTHGRYEPLLHPPPTGRTAGSLYGERTDEVQGERGFCGRRVLRHCELCIHESAPYTVQGGQRCRWLGLFFFGYYFFGIIFSRLSKNKIPARITCHIGGKVSLSDTQQQSRMQNKQPEILWDYIWYFYKKRKKNLGISATVSLTLRRHVCSPVETVGPLPQRMRRTRMRIALKLEPMI